MKKEELEKYEKLLLKKREELLESIVDKRNQTGKTTRDATGDLSVIRTTWPIKARMPSSERRLS